MKFFVLTDNIDSISSTEYLPVGRLNLDEAPLCPLCERAMGMLTWLPPYKVEIEFWGEEAGDIVFGPHNDFLVSEYFMKSYQAFGLQGLHGFIPAEVIKIKRKNRRAPKEAPPYYRVSVLRTKSLIDHESSGLVLERPWTCDYCRLSLIKRTQRLVLFEDTWTGEDIFYARGLPGTIITSERFRNFCLEAGIKNGELIAADQYHFDFYPNEDK